MIQLDEISKEHKIKMLIDFIKKLDEDGVEQLLLKLPSVKQNVIVSEERTEFCEHLETYKKVRFGVELIKCKKCRKILSQNSL